MTPFNNVEGLNSARQAIIDSTLSRCQKTNQDYTITLPTPQPLGKIVCGLAACICALAFIDLSGDHVSWVGMVQLCEPRFGPLLSSFISTRAHTGPHAQNRTHGPSAGR